MPLRQLQPEFRHYGQVAAGLEEIGPHLERRRHDGRTRKIKSAGAERIQDERTERIIGCRKGPRLSHEIRQPDAASLNPRASQTGRHDVGTLEQTFEADPAVEIFSKVAMDQKVDAAFIEAAPVLIAIEDLDVEGDPRITPCQTVNHGRDKACGDRRRCPDAYIARAWVGEKIDVLDALPQLVEGGVAAAEHGAAVVGEFDSTRVSLQQAHSER